MQIDIYFVRRVIEFHVVTNNDYFIFSLCWDALMALEMISFLFRPR